MATHTSNSMLTEKSAISVKLRGGHFAPLPFYLAIDLQVSKCMETLQKERLYTLREIIGEAYWDELRSNAAKRMAGRCFADMVSNAVFPLKFVQYKRYCTKRYQLK